ncbi:MAG: metal-dependent hydrolase [Candidatus Taylorbacteria bacterium]|nr:metal-dependent hydrolase [Candidatus Taylorbacteria bacterium]
MVLPGHLAGGFLATKLLFFISGAIFTPAQTTILYVIGILASEMPDLDLITFFFEHKSLKLQKTDSHRKYISHAPIVWLILSLLIVLVGYIIGNQFTSYIGWVILFGSWSHFVFDSIEYGIMWLWPFSKHFYCLRTVPPEEIDDQKGTLGYYWTFIWKYYVKFWTFYLEIIIIMLALWVAFH